MANVLSQNEIDELLNALAMGSDAEIVQEEPAAKGNVREYNFRTANKFPKEQIRTLQFIYESFARLLSTHLSSLLRAMVDATVISVEEQTFSEFTNSLPSSSILAILNVPPLEGSLLMQFSREIVYAMINRLFGGVNASEITENKPFTEIELVVIERLIRQFMSQLNEAWMKVIKVRAMVDRIETSGQFAQIVAMNEPIAIITLNVSVGNVNGLLNVCIPHLAIEPVAKQLNMRTWISTGSIRQVESHSETLSQQLQNTVITMQAGFDKTPATIRDILSLHTGDVIRLDHSINRMLTVNVEHIPKFRGLIGIYQGHYAIQVAEIIKEDASDE